MPETRTKWFGKGDEWQGRTWPWHQTVTGRFDPQRLSHLKDCEAKELTREYLSKSAGEQHEMLVELCCHDGGLPKAQTIAKQLDVQGSDLRSEMVKGGFLRSIKKLFGE